MDSSTPSSPVINYEYIPVYYFITCSDHRNFVSRILAMISVNGHPGSNLPRLPKMVLVKIMHRWLMDRRETNCVICHEVVKCKFKCSGSEFCEWLETRELKMIASHKAYTRHNYKHKIVPACDYRAIRCSRTFYPLKINDKNYWYPSCANAQHDVKNKERYREALIDGTISLSDL